DVERNGLALEAKRAGRTMRAGAPHREPRLRGLGYTVRRRFHRAPDRSGFGRVGADQQPTGLVGEGLELGPERVHFGVVAADVMDEPDRRMIADERAVGLAGLRDDRAVGGTGEKGSGHTLTSQRRAAESARAEGRHQGLPRAPTP